MPIVSPIRRTHRPTGREIARFVEAMVLVSLAWAAIRLLPFRQVMRTTGVGPAPRTTPDARAVGAGVRQAVKRALRRLPWPIVCFPEGLATQWMLRRRGLPSVLHYGLRPSAERLSAHVWVTLDGETIVGEESSDPHHCVAIFPKAAD